MGNDRLVGGAGFDTAVFSSRKNSINLGSMSRQTTGDGRDILRGIENVKGGAGNDTINGNSSANTLNGGANNDTLYGGLGNDTLTGGTGNDIFQIRSGTGAPPKTKGWGRLPPP